MSNGDHNLTVMYHLFMGVMWREKDKKGHSFSILHYFYKTQVGHSPSPLTRFCSCCF